MQNKYAFLMIDYDTPSFIKDIHSQLLEDELYKEEEGDKGIELDTHVTLAPCLDNDIDLEELKQHLLPLSKYTILLNNVSTFDNELYDVLKCDVQCDFLHNTNHKLKTIYPMHTEYDEYHPHLTIAYLNKGVCDRFKKDILTPLVVLKPKQFHYSFYDENGIQQKIKFK